VKLRCTPPTVLNDDEIGQITEAAIRIAARVPLRVGGASETSAVRSRTTNL